MMATKAFDFNFPQRFEYDPERIEFRTSGGSTTARLFKSGMGRNVLRSLAATFNDNVGGAVTVPDYIRDRLTDGNPDLPFRFSDVVEMRFDLGGDIDVKRVKIFHEIGTQPNDVVVATSIDGITHEVHWSNDADDSLGLGWTGTDPTFIAGTDGLTVDLNCHRARYLHVFTKGFTSSNPSDPSSDETRISEVELYDCVYHTDRPTLVTKEEARLTDFTSLTESVIETGNAFLLWRVLVNGTPMWWDGSAWIEATADVDRNSTAEMKANLDLLFSLPTVYNVAFDVAFVSETGEATPEMDALSVDFENSATGKAKTTRVYGQVNMENSGRPDADVWVSATLESSADLVAATTGSRSNIFITNDPGGGSDSAVRVDSQGIFFFDLAPSTSLTTGGNAAKTKWTFTFWRPHHKNKDRLIAVGSVSAEIPNVTRYDLGTNVIA